MSFRGQSAAAAVVGLTAEHASQSLLLLPAKPVDQDHLWLGRAAAAAAAAGLVADPCTNSDSSSNSISNSHPVLQQQQHKLCCFPSAPTPTCTTAKRHPPYPHVTPQCFRFTRQLLHRCSHMNRLLNATVRIVTMHNTYCLYRCCCCCCCCCHCHCCCCCLAPQPGLLRAVHQHGPVPQESAGLPR